MKAVIAAVNAKYVHTGLAARTLAAYAASHGAGPVTVLETTINQPYDRILERLFLEQADVHLLSCYIWNWDVCRRLAKDLPLLTKAPVFLGGPQVSFRAEETLRELPGVRGVLRGEGEHSVTRLLLALRQEEALDRVPSLSFREGEGVRHTPDAPPLSLCELPFCYDDISEMEHRIVYAETSRGCPFRCAYCLSGLDRSVRWKPLEQVFLELHRFLEARVPQVKLCDRTFNARSEHSDAIWRYLMEHDNGVTSFHFEITGELLGDEQLALLARARPGQFRFEIGVQSTHKPTLSAVGRPANLQRLFEVCRRLKAMGNVTLHLDLIAGLPLEGFERFSQSFDEVYRLEPDELQLGFLKLLPGCALEARKEIYGLVCRSEPPYEVLRTADLSPRELFRLRRVARMVDVFYNSGAFRDELRRLTARFSRPFALYSALSDRFAAHGYFDAPPSRRALAGLLNEQAGSGAVEDGKQKAGVCHADQPLV